MKEVAETAQSDSSRAENSHMAWQSHTESMQAALAAEGVGGGGGLRSKSGDGRHCSPEWFWLYQQQVPDAWLSRLTGAPWWRWRWAPRVVVGSGQVVGGVQLPALWQTAVLLKRDQSRKKRGRGWKRVRDKRTDQRRIKGCESAGKICTRVP